MSKALETGLSLTRGVVHALIEEDPGCPLVVMLPNGEYHEVEAISSNPWSTVLVLKQDKATERGTGTL